MDILRIRKLAGISSEKPEIESNPMISETTVIPVDASLDHIASMFDAGKRALALVNKLKNPADKKKHLSAVFTNINKIRGALARMIEKETK